MYAVTAVVNACRNTPEAMTPEAMISNKGEKEEQRIIESSYCIRPKMCRLVLFWLCESRMWSLVQIPQKCFAGPRTYTPSITSLEFTILNSDISPALLSRCNKWYLYLVGAVAANLESNITWSNNVEKDFYQLI